MEKDSYLECSNCEIPFEVRQIHRRYETAFRSLDHQVRFCPFCGLSFDISDEEWIEAKDHFDSHMRIYQDLLGKPGVATGPALMVTFEPLLRRYNSGERSRDLYEAMLGVE